MTDPTTDMLGSFSSAAANLVAKAAPAIVSVHSHHARASGFVWKPGLAVTADGKILYDTRSSAVITALSQGQTACDQFTYAIRLANGTLSWATP